MDISRDKQSTSHTKKREHGEDSETLKEKTEFLLIAV